MLWLGLAYLGALAALFITSFWDQNPFTGDVYPVVELSTTSASSGSPTSTAGWRSARSGSPRA